MAKIKTLKEIKQKHQDLINQTVNISGWVRNNRNQKEFGFLIINDGTTFETIQVVYDKTNKDFDIISKINTGSSVSVTGILISTPENQQKYEIKSIIVNVLGECPVDYPIQPKRHTREFLRENAHLRVRTNLFNAVFRLRSVTAFAIHEFFIDNDFTYIHTPLITANDGEGAGQTFTVTTLNLDNIPKNEDRQIDFKKDFFGKQTNLTVTGQLEAEALALGLRNVYTFGPTFRAENSNTQTHASEFWMIEPEMAFCDLKGVMKVSEQLVKYVIKHVLKKMKDEMNFFDKFVQPGLIEKLNNIISKKFPRITHAQAITILKDSGQKFDNEPMYNDDLAKEHEKYLTDVYFKGPVFVYNWPKEIKAFYMKINKDNKTVAAVDLLVPQSGELIGGSQREENYDKLLERMQQLNMDIEPLQWYLDLRKYGTCEHGGFGVGFERLLMYLSGIENIRDVIAFARTPKNCEF